MTLHLLRLDSHQTLGVRCDAVEGEGQMNKIEAFINGGLRDGRKVENHANKFKK